MGLYLRPKMRKKGVIERLHVILLPLAREGDGCSSEEEGTMIVTEHEIGGFTKTQQTARKTQAAMTKRMESSASDQRKDQAKSFPKRKRQRQKSQQKSQK